MKNIKGYRETLNEAADQELLNKELLAAAEGGNTDMVKDLLDRGAHVDAEDEDGWTPIHIAAKYGHINVIRLLLDKGVHVDARDKDSWTPLSIAAVNRNQDLIRFLLDRGAEVDAEDKYGRTALCRAAIMDKIDNVKLLIQRGADPFKFFNGPDDLTTFFNGDVDWWPEGLKTKLRRIQRSRQAFGM